MSTQSQREKRIVDPTSRSLQRKPSSCHSNLNHSLNKQGKKAKRKFLNFERMNFCISKKTDLKT
jgi:hypothetical protein